MKQAFIQADFDFIIFMKLRDGCGDKSGRVVKLNKSVYGLKQAGVVAGQCVSVMGSLAR